MIEKRGPLNQPPREPVATSATTTKGLLELRDWLMTLCELYDQRFHEDRGIRQIIRGQGTR